MNFKSILKVLAIAILTLSLTPSVLAMKQLTNLYDILWPSGGGWEDDIQRCLKSGDDINSTRNDNRDTLLHMVSNWSNKKNVKQLLDHGANTNCVNKSGDTPLHLASYKGKKEIVKLLLNRGAIINPSGANDIESVLAKVREQGKEGLGCRTEKDYAMIVQLIEERLLYQQKCNQRILDTWNLHNKPNNNIKPIIAFVHKDKPKQQIFKQAMNYLITQWSNFMPNLSSLDEIGK